MTLLIKVETYLRTYLCKEVEAFFLASPRQMCEERYLYVTYVAAVFLGTSRLLVYHGSSVLSFYFLLPSYLGVVYLRHNGAYRGEILLAHIAERQTSRESACHLLRHLRFKAYVAHNVTSVDTYREVGTVFSHLCRRQTAESAKYYDKNSSHRYYP